MVFITQATYVGKGTDKLKPSWSYPILVLVSPEKTVLTGVTIVIRITPFVGGSWSTNMPYTDKNVENDWHFPTGEDGLAFAKRWVSGIDNDLELSQENSKLVARNKDLTHECNTLKAKIAELRSTLEQMEKDSLTDHENMDKVSQDMTSQVQDLKEQLLSLSREDDLVIGEIESLKKTVSQKDEAISIMATTIKSQADVIQTLLKS